MSTARGLPDRPANASPCRSCRRQGFDKRQAHFGGARLLTEIVEKQMLRRYGAIVQLDPADRRDALRRDLKILENRLEPDDPGPGEMTMQQQECVADIGADIDDNPER